MIARDDGRLCSDWHRAGDAAICIIADGCDGRTAEDRARGSSEIVTGCTVGAARLHGPICDVGIGCLQTSQARRVIAMSDRGTGRGGRRESAGGTGRGGRDATRRDGRRDGLLDGRGRSSR